MLDCKICCKSHIKCLNATFIGPLNKYGNFLTRFKVHTMHNLLKLNILSENEMTHEI